MKTLFLVVSLVVLAGCTKQPVSPAGVYRLSTEEKSMVLELRPAGDYVLQINGAERNPDQIRGRWDEEQGPGPDISLHGIVWRGTEPEAGPGIWAVSVDNETGICIDDEGLACFSKDDPV